jgi:hypothetical protein
MKESIRMTVDSPALRLLTSENMLGRDTQSMAEARF